MDLSRINPDKIMSDNIERDAEEFDRRLDETQDAPASQLKRIVKRRLFYYHDGVGYYVPLESLEDLKNYLEGLYDGDTLEVTFKRKDMTDEEFENLPQD